MAQTLVRHGDGWAVVIDDRLLERLEIGPDTPLEVTTDGRSLSIAPADPARPAQFAAALESVNQRFGRALKKLAE